MKLSEYDIGHPQAAIVKESTRITPLQLDVEVRHIVFELSESGIEYVEGQSVGVLPPGPHTFGNDQHLRLYSIASSRQGEKSDKRLISLCVRRCFYVDPVSGERYPGEASNYLCDALPGDQVLITGPYGHQFNVPNDESSNILMIGMGTGIAPFRAFIKHIYDDHKRWKGIVRLFYGARSGMEMLYLNDAKRDIDQYYDEETFKAFQAVSPRPHFDVPPALERLLSENAVDILNLIDDPKTYVYVAGLEEAAKAFNNAMIFIVGSESAWDAKRDELVSQNRFSELLY